LKQVKNYQPQPYGAKIILVEAMESLNNANESTDKSSGKNINWHNLSTELVDCHRISGNHYSIFIEPHVQSLAEKLKSYL